jgi:hypothetical protein
MYETLIGVVFGALITYLMSYLLEKRKHTLEMHKYIFDFKRQKIEEIYNLIEKSKKYAKMTPLNLIDNQKSGQHEAHGYSPDDYSMLKNILFLYFNEQENLIKNIHQADELFKKAQDINGELLSIKNDLSRQKEINRKVLLAWKNFEDKLEEIKSQLPSVYKNLEQIK